MSKKITINIPKPCSENWNEMTIQEKGRFCLACQTTVIDFSKMSKEEIIEFFKNPPQKVCGRFKQDQLKTYQLETAKHRFLGHWFGLFLSYQVLALSPLIAQNPAEQAQTIRQNPSIYTPQKLVFQGRILDSLEKSEIPGGNILIKGTNVRTQSDAEGKFSLALEESYFLNNQVVVQISFIGFMTQEIMIEKDSILQNYEILLKADDRVLSGDVIVVVGAINNNNFWHRLKNKFRFRRNR